ncbi:hypothetical protein chiPu_0016534 [Chiloscyllium punctatum]|uniref:Uncharacterized protein n=1 Tax=Chiloscyllium punctatum TaxID=137246 RepID=A0A401T5S6_CHIPU|nr:hypothetical protein [Chiloscyllium punctatum]
MAADVQLSKEQAAQFCNNPTAVTHTPFIVESPWLPKDLGLAMRRLPQRPLHFMRLGQAPVPLVEVARLGQDVFCVRGAPVTLQAL